MAATMEPSSISNGALRAQVRRARGKFAAMAGTYCLGVFNDNFFKQAACLMAVYAGRVHLQSLAVIVFTLPWLLFAAPAGWLADRFSKRNIVIASKLLELAAMLCGGIGVLTVDWTLILLMMFLMALQSTIFSPALNGSIPELFPPAYVIRANSTIKMLVMAGTLVGIILAGVLLNYKQPVWGVALGRLIVGLGVIGISLAGVVLSFGVAHRPAADPSVKFPWTGPGKTVGELLRIRRDRLLWTVLLGDLFVWFVAAWQIQIINQMGVVRFGLNEQQTSYLLTPELIGVGLGGLLAGRLAKGKRWYRVLTPSMVALGLVTVFLSAAPSLPQRNQLPCVVAGLFLAGVAGGVMLIPMEAFFQIRPAPEKKGAVIAATNFAGFLGILLSAPADMLFQHLRIEPILRFGVVGALSLIAAAGLGPALRREARG